MEVTIRQATTDDIEEIAKLFDAYRVFYEQGSDLSLAQEFLGNRLNNLESVIFCAYTSDEHCVGFAQLYPSFSSVSAKRIWILNDLFVLESVRGMGIGTKPQKEDQVITLGIVIAAKQTMQTLLLSLNRLS